MFESIVFLEHLFILITICLFGICLGSFANVLIYRIPRQLNIAWPRSSCPQCRFPILWRDNIPVFSWILLQGKCRNCHKKISFRYPLVELITGFLFVCLYLHLGWSWTYLEYSLFSFGLVVVTFIDIDHMILPDVFTWPGIFIGLLGGLLSPERRFIDSFIGFSMGFGFLWAVAYIYLLIRKEEGMGGGDIKLMGWIGAVLGWKSVPFVILCSSVIGSLLGIFLALRKNEGLKSTIPFGPYLAISAIIYIFGGEKISQWYLHLFLPDLISPN